MQKFVVALFYKINPVQIATIIAENTENSLNSLPHTIESRIYCYSQIHRIFAGFRKGITQILGKFAQSGSEMAKIARPAQDIPIFGTIAVLLHTDREINHNFS